MRIKIILEVLFAICFAFSSTAETLATDAVKLQAQVVKLQKENQLLRKENQKLRAELVAKETERSAETDKTVSKHSLKKPTAKLLKNLKIIGLQPVPRNVIIQSAVFIKIQKGALVVKMRE